MEKIAMAVVPFLFKNNGCGRFPHPTDIGCGSRERQIKFRFNNQTYPSKIIDVGIFRAQ
jgi:hypothetical protein